VSYLNTKPLLYGFINHQVMQDMVLTENYPSKIAGQLIRGQVDLALVPVAIIPELPEYHIVGDYCIGADGAVASVALFSEVPLADIQQIYLDYQSRTSVVLLKILCRDLWKIHPRFIETTEEFTGSIRQKDAGLLIGDRALAQRQVSPYQYDLAAAWKEFTGLPFVFAAWISNKVLPPRFIAAFNEASKIGISHIGEVVRQNASPWIDLGEYYTKYISYTLTSDKRKGLALFLELMEGYEQSHGRNS
jgi:chorismate dehydratase